MRNKAKQIQEGDDVVDFAVDRDETYNADEGIVLSLANNKAQLGL